VRPNLSTNFGQPEIRTLRTGSPNAKLQSEAI
jgi:hypothetical protein